MKKKDLLEILEKSIFKDDVSIQGLYKKYYPLIEATLQPFPNKTKINGLVSLQEISTKNSFDTFLRANSTEDIEKKLCQLLKELRAWAREQQMQVKKIPSGLEQRRMREEVINRLDTFMLYFEGLEDNTIGLQIKLKTAKNDLNEMFLPKNDLRVISCYDTIMEELDKITFDNSSKCGEAVYNAAEIVLKYLNEWCKLKR